MSNSLYIATMEPRAGKSTNEINEGIQFARESYESHGCTIISTIANRVVPVYLSAVNNLYKAIQRSAKAVAIGPILQGLNKPVNDLSRGATIADIINTVAITAIQAQAVSDDG